MGGCLSGGGGGGLSDTTRIDDGRKMSGSILASEHHIQSLQHDLEEFKNKLTDADNRINELETMIQDKTKELDIIRGERLEWQITATNAVNDRHYYEEQLYRIQCDIDDRKRDNDDDEEEEEIIKLKDELMKNNAKWREMLKREREIRNAYERILINIGYMPSEITTGVVHVVKNVLMNTHEQRRLAELQLITGGDNDNNSNEEEEEVEEKRDTTQDDRLCYDPSSSMMMIDVGKVNPVNFRLPLPAGSLHWQRSIAVSTSRVNNDTHPHHHRASSCHIDWKAAVKAASIDAKADDDNGLYNIAMRLAQPNEE